jgi:SAM-dependent methyltransferase
MGTDSQGLGDDNERVVPFVQDWNYFSHLSVYSFAAQFLQGLRIVDAGCGTGYGAAYLARHGALQVTGLDISEPAISYCRNEFVLPNLDFQVCDLSAAMPFPGRSVDAIFSSQAMEHLADIEAFLDEAHRVLKPDGLMVVAVPAIVSPEQLEENIWNRFHITNLTPLGWFTKIGRRFRRVTPYRHWPKAPFAGWERIRSGLRLLPQDTVIRETDYDYIETPIASLNSCTETLNAVLVARRPRRRVRPPHVAEFVPHAWKEGAIHAKIRHEETELLRWKLWQAEPRHPAGSD